MGLGVWLLGEGEGSGKSMACEEMWVPRGGCEDAGAGGSKGNCSHVVVPCQQQAALLRLRQRVRPAVAAHERRIRWPLKLWRGARGRGQAPPLRLRPPRGALPGTEVCAEGAPVLR